MNASRMALALHVALAQQPVGIKRSELQREDLVVPGREVVQIRVELEPGVLFECHKCRQRPRSRARNLHRRDRQAAGSIGPIVTGALPCAHKLST
jgi:hypothetical protein